MGKSLQDSETDRSGARVGLGAKPRKAVSGTLSVVCRTEDLFCQTAGYFCKICIKMRGAFYIDCLCMLTTG